MALDHYSVVVNSTTPTILARGAAGDAHTRVYISNGSGEDLFVGDETVSTTDGYLIPKQQSTTISYRQEFDLSANDVLYGICLSPNTTTVRVIVTY